MRGAGDPVQDATQSPQILTFFGRAQLFWDLSSADAAQRKAAAQRLVAALVKAQTAGSGAPEDATFGDEGALCQDLIYCLRRLIRGLASSRDGAREGFGLALMLALRACPAVDAEKLFAFALETLQVKGGGSAQEEKECGFGRLFLCLALARAGRCDAAPLAQRVAEELLRIQGTKSFVAEACSHTLQVLAESVPRAALAESLAPLLRGRLDGVEKGDMAPEQLELMVCPRAARGSRTLNGSRPRARPLPDTLDARAHHTLIR
jgi:DNA polymerase phi